MSLLENMAKHIIIIKDSILDEILQFLDSCQCELNAELYFAYLLLTTSYIYCWPNGK